MHNKQNDLHKIFNDLYSPLHNTFENVFLKKMLNMLLLVILKSFKLIMLMIIMMMSLILIYVSFAIGTFMSILKIIKFFLNATKVEKHLIPSNHSYYNLCI